MNIRKMCGIFLRCFALVFGVDNAKCFDARLRFHRKLNLKKPKTLADKVSYIELHEPSSLAPMCTDKFAVRDYITQKGLSHILIPVIGGPWNSAEAIDFSMFPDAFVIKATHGCKMNYLVPNKCGFDEVSCRSKIREWLGTTYGTYSMEPHYAQIAHRVYAEEYLRGLDSIVDYKFHCLNGVPQFVLTCSNRHCDARGKMAVTLDLFDMNWNPISELQADGNEIPGDGTLKKPSRFDEMVDVAQKLSRDFKFVRVDLYEINGKVLFGELTFSPACCVFPYFSDEFNERMGKLLTV